MTAADDGLRDALAEALPESLGPVGLRRRAIPALDVEGSVTGYGVALLDALLPTVQALIAAEQEAALAEAQSGLLAHRDQNVRPGDDDWFGKGWNSALNFAADWIGHQFRAALGTGDREDDLFRLPDPEPTGPLAGGLITPENPVGGLRPAGTVDPKDPR